MALNDLFQPIQVGHLNIKNRLCMSAMNENMCTFEGAPTDHQIAYFEERAKGGVGMIVTGNAYVDDYNSQIASGQLGVYSDRLVPHLFRLADRVKMAGARIVMQLVHGGRQASYAWNTPLWAPSAIACPVVGIETRAMTDEEIHKTIENFIQGARRARDAGFDGVELHCGHGYLLSEFLSPRTNKREDDYGGSIENRARMPLEIIRGIRALIGKHFIIGVKMNGKEEIEEGITPEMAEEYAKSFEKAGCDYITVSAGIYETGDEQCHSLYVERGQNVPYAQRIKQVVSIPVIVVGSINIPEVAADVVSSGKADMVAMGRPLLADPELPRKVKSGQLEDVRLCIRCNDCQGRLVENRVITCAVNPAVGKEREFQIVPALQKKRVLVIGGGPGGLEAARVSALRGHQVILLEKKDKLGGTCLPTLNPEFKKELDHIPKYQSVQLQKLGVDVRLSTQGTVNSILAYKPDVVIIAGGATPIEFEFPGDRSIDVVQAIHALNGHGTIGNSVAVIGAGLVGCETALATAKEWNKKTYLITRRSADQAAAGINALAAWSLINELKKFGVEIIGNHDVARVDNGSLIIEHVDTKAQRPLTVDTILPARGFRPNLELVSGLQGEVPEVYAIGDSIEPGTILEAFAQGAYVARQI